MRQELLPNDVAKSLEGSESKSEGELNKGNSTAGELGAEAKEEQPLDVAVPEQDERRAAVPLWVSIFTPFWVVNRTGLVLQYADPPENGSQGDGRGLAGKSENGYESLSAPHGELVWSSKSSFFESLAVYLFPLTSLL